MIPLSSIDYTALTDATCRNNFIGELIGAQPLQQIYLARNGTMLWPTSYDVAELDNCRENLARWQSTAKEWRSFTKATSDIDPSWRGQLTLEVHKWHRRYSEVPAGGWSVIEHLAEHHCDDVHISKVAAGWHLSVVTKAEREFSQIAPTVQEAACLMAVKIIEPAA